MFVRLLQSKVRGVAKCTSTADDALLSAFSFLQPPRSISQLGKLPDNQALPLRSLRRSPTSKSTFQPRAAFDGRRASSGARTGLRLRLAGVHRAQLAGRAAAGSTEPARHAILDLPLRRPISQLRVAGWQTFRGKVEIFPGDGNPPPGYPGSTGDISWGYDALPAYNYAAPVMACDSRRLDTI